MQEISHPLDFFSYLLNKNFSVLINVDTLDNTYDKYVRTDKILYL